MYRPESVDVVAILVDFFQLQVVQYIYTAILLGAGGKLPLYEGIIGCVAWDVSQCLCVCWTRAWALQKRINRSRWCVERSGISSQISSPKQKKTTVQRLLVCSFSLASITDVTSISRRQQRFFRCFCCPQRSERLVLQQSYIVSGWLPYLSA